MSSKSIRKIINIDELTTWANNILASPSLTLFMTFMEGEEKDYTYDKAYRVAIIHMLEHVKFKTNTYRGFTYTASELLPDGTLKPDYDETRRFYF